MKKRRLLTDTCAALKLLAIEKIFTPGTLAKGDLVIHPCVFSETRLLPKEKREKYKSELGALQRVRATPGLKPPARELEAQLSIIKMTSDQIDASLSNADAEQLAAVVYDGDMDLITNDQPLAKVAEYFEVDTYSAEAILCEALANAALTPEEASGVVRYWIANNEPISRSDKAILRQHKLI